MASELIYLGTLSANNMGYYYQDPDVTGAGIGSASGLVPGAQSSIPTCTDFESLPIPATFNASEGITSTEQELKNLRGVEAAQQGAPAVNGPPLTAQGAVQNQAFWKWE
jgi:hypothetical protein